MENVSMDIIQKAMALFMRLLEKSKITKRNDPELFSAYEDYETATVLDTLAEEAGILLLRTSDTLYYTPRADNKALGYTNEELRSSMGLSNNTELYIIYVIMLCLIIKFYNGESYNVKCRTLLKVEELERFVTSKFQMLGQREEGVEEDEALGYNFTAASRVWLDLPAYDEKITSFARSSGTRISYLYKTLHFLKNQGLVLLDSDNEIFTTEKLDIMATAYYPESERKKAILDYLDLLAEEENNAVH